MMEAVLVTGGAGFVGSHVLDHLYANTDWQLVALDRLTYAGSLERISHLKGPRLEFLHHDFRSPFPPSLLEKMKGIRYIIHNGGETHVDNSLRDPLPFMESNVVGTMNVLEAARKLEVEHVIYTSTDEVFGPAPDGTNYKEDDPLRPSNPYSASKAAAEALCYAWWNSYGLPTTVMRTMNMIGEKQNPEKFVALCMRKIFKGEVVSIHASASGKMGSRNWLHARNQADAMLFLIQNEVGAGQSFHIAGEEHTNLEIAQYIAQFMGMTLKHKIVDAETHRRGHDLRYSLDDSKLRSLGWNPPVPFMESLEKVVHWTMKNRNWLELE